MAFNTTAIYKAQLRLAVCSHHRNISQGVKNFQIPTAILKRGEQNFTFQPKKIHCASARGSVRRGHGKRLFCLATQSKAKELSDTPVDEKSWIHVGKNCRIRKAKPSEYRRVAEIQAEAFHEPSVIKVLDGMFLKFFQAEVYDSLLQKAKWTAENRFCCLVAVSDDDEVVGVGEVSIHGDQDVLRVMRGDEYAYICCMAVDPAARRQFIATDILVAANQVAQEWGFDQVCLHVFDVNNNAVTCYERAGFEIQQANAPWSVSFIGQSRKMLMVKEFPKESVEALEDTS